MRAAKFILIAAILCGQLLAFDEGAELQAIAFKEKSPRGQIGKLGERGIYQMLPCNVAKYGGYEKAHALAMMHDIIAQLKAHRIDVNAFNVALAWNAGINAVIRGKCPISSYQYALTVQVQYHHLTTPSRPLGQRD